RRLPTSSFERLFMNRWTAAEDRVVSPEDLAAAVVLDGPQDPQPGRSYVVGVDVGVRRDRTAIAVAHAESVPNRVPAAARVVLDRMLVFAGTPAREVSLGSVEEAIFETSRRYGGAVVRMDPWQMIGSKQRLLVR